jgi:hypothetical protein
MHAESHCPGNVNSVTLRLIQRSQIVVPVMINLTGPYDFMVDTGAQVTIVDPALAAALNLPQIGTAGVAAVGSYARVPLVRLDSVEAGSQMVADVSAAIQDLGQTQLADHRVRGVLGGNFLEHFDLLIDYSHGFLCFDGSMQMRSKMRGVQIPMIALPITQQNLSQKLIVPVHIPGIEKRQLLLQLDSGTNAPLLFQACGELNLEPVAGATLRTRGTDGLEHSFTVLRSQDLKVGPHLLRKIAFVTPIKVSTNVPKEDVDGLLPTGLFQRVFISYAERYVVLDAW